MTELQRKFRGGLFAITAITAFACTFVSGGYLTQNNLVSPFILCLLRFAIAGLTMLAYGLCVPTLRKQLLSVSRRDNLTLLWLGPIGTAIMAWTLFEGCKLISPTNASLADALTPLGIFVIGSIRNRQISLLEFVGLVFGFSGALFVIGILSTTHGFTLEAYSFGDFLIVLSATAWGIYTFFGRGIVRRIGSYAFTTYSMLYGALFMLIISFILQPISTAEIKNHFFQMPATGHAWLLVLVLSYFSTLMPFSLWNLAQRDLPVTVLGMTTYFSTIITALIAYITVGEVTTPSQWLGALLICSAAVIECGRKHD